VRELQVVLAPLLVRRWIERCSSHCLMLRPKMLDQAGSLTIDVVHSDQNADKLELWQKQGSSIPTTKASSLVWLLQWSPAIAHKGHWRTPTCCPVEQGPASVSCRTATDIYVLVYPNNIRANFVSTTNRTPRAERETLVSPISDACFESAIYVYDYYDGSHLVYGSLRKTAIRKMKGAAFDGIL
jgi:hypothetical protein